MTDFENRVWDIMNSNDPDYVKLEKIRKLYTPNIDPAACKNDRFYWIVVSDYETIGWRNSNSELPWVVRWLDDSLRFEEDSKITVLGEYHPEDEYIDRVYDRIEDAIEDGMGRYTVLEDSNGSRWIFDNGVGISNHFAPFTVIHWVPKEAGE
jgi:hypothetical protein